MIFTKVDALVKDIDVDKYHIETVILSSDDLNKKIIRVKSDHGNEFGIRLDKGQKLQNGSAFFIDDHHVLAIGVESQDLIVISPKDMDEMGITAHILGNTHKPIEVKDAKIYLEVDPVVEQVLTQKEIAYTIEEVVLDKPLRHVNLTAHGTLIPLRMCLCKIILKLYKLSIQLFQLDHLTTHLGWKIICAKTL